MGDGNDSQPKGFGFFSWGLELRRKQKGAHIMNITTITDAPCMK